MAQWNMTQSLYRMKFCNNVNIPRVSCLVKWVKKRKINLYVIIYILSQKIRQTSVYILTKQKQTHRYREETSGYQWGEGRGRGEIEVED